MKRRSGGPTQAKFGGACIGAFDWELQSFRTPMRRYLIDLARWGQALSEVATVGNPVAYLTKENGSPVDPRLQQVKTAALIGLMHEQARPYRGVEHHRAGLPDGDR